MKGPEVSVLIPTRDRPRHLLLAVNSALAQHDVDLEIMVVHDGPAGDALDALPGLADARLRAFATPRQAGMAAARNAGLERCNGQWVAFLDDDDLWSPTKLREQLDTARAHDAGLVYSSVISVDDRGRLIAKFGAPDPDGLLDALLRWNVIPAGSSNVMANRTTVMHLGGWDTGFGHLGDWDLWIRLAGRVPVACSSRIAVAYVQHAAARSLAPANELLEDAQAVAAKHARLASARGVAPNQAALSRFVAERQRRAGRRLSAARFYLGAARHSRRPRDLALSGHALLGLPVPKRRAPAAEPWIRPLSQADEPRG